MNSSVTGIQAIPASFPFPGTEHTSGGVIRPNNTLNSVDKHDNGSQSAAEATRTSTADQVKTLSTSVKAPASRIVETPPAKIAGVVEPLDTVTLSSVDKVRQLRQQGEGDKQIATKLSLPLKEVQSDLHLDANQHLSFTVAPVAGGLPAIAAIDSAGQLLDQVSR